MPHIFKYNENSKSVLETLVREKLIDGIEGYYSYYSQEQQQFVLEFAKNIIYIFQVEVIHMVLLIRK
ncbi:MAG: hypothetical protein HFJ37_01170 [Clostridia bacterium]|nr:hypothetical protein [Clostridia bacterium]